MNVLFISGHIYQSPRQAGFHFLSRAFSQCGHSVRFMTVGISFFSLLRNDSRISTLIKYQGINRWVKNRDGISSYAFFTLWHPIHLHSKALNQVSTYFFSKYGKLSRRVSEELINADMIVVESGVGLMLLNEHSESLIRHGVRVVYRVSDDLNFLNVHPIIRKSEIIFLSSGLPCLISCPSDSIAERLKPYHDSTFIHRHGIDTQVYDACATSPYEDNTINAIFVGLSHLDVDVLRFLVISFPSVDFHIFGVKLDFSRPNLHQYGEVPFFLTVSYVKYASLGLQTLLSGNDSSLKHSLKIQQYSYCGLPIVGPINLDTGWRNYFGYDRENPDSILQSFQEAIENGHCWEAKNYVHNWQSLADQIISESVC